MSTVWRRTVGRATLIVATTVTSATSLGLLVTAAVKVNYGPTDDVIAVSYVWALLLLYQLTSWLLPRTRERSRR